MRGQRPRRRWSARWFTSARQRVLLLSSTGHRDSVLRPNRVTDHPLTVARDVGPTYTADPSSSGGLGVPRPETVRPILLRTQYLDGRLASDWQLQAPIRTKKRPVGEEPPRRIRLQHFRASPTAGCLTGLPFVAGPSQRPPWMLPCVFVACVPTGRLRTEHWRFQLPQTCNSLPLALHSFGRLPCARKSPRATKKDTL